MARVRPSSLSDPLDRLVGEAPALQSLRAPMRQGLTAFQAAGEARLLLLFWALMAEMYECLGRVTAGLSTLNTALALARKAGYSDYEAELYHSRGVVARAHCGASCRGRRLFSPSSCRRPPPVGQLLGAAGGHAPEPALVGSG